jgi:hypothetical protein
MPRVKRRIVLDTDSASWVLGPIERKSEHDGTGAEEENEGGGLTILILLGERREG